MAVVRNDGANARKAFQDKSTRALPREVRREYLWGNAPVMVVFLVVRNNRCQMYRLYDTTLQ
jgi:hypothetical protein